MACLTRDPDHLRFRLRAESLVLDPSEKPVATSVERVETKSGRSPATVFDLKRLYQLTPYGYRIVWQQSVDFALEVIHSAGIVARTVAFCGGSAAASTALTAGGKELSTSRDVAGPIRVANFRNKIPSSVIIYLTLSLPLNGRSTENAS